MCTGVGFLFRFHQQLHHNLSSSSCFLKIQFAIIALLLLLSFIVPVFNPLPIFLYYSSNSVHIQLWSSYFGSSCDCFCSILPICRPPPAMPSPIFQLGCVAHPSSVRPLCLVPLYHVHLINCGFCLSVSRPLNQDGVTRPWGSGCLYDSYNLFAII